MPSPTGNAGRVLVVDDDRTTRLVNRSVLAKAGFTVGVAKDGAEAIARLRARRYDLMLLDVWMPGMGGLDLLERLKQDEHRPKIVVPTSEADAWSSIASPIQAPGSSWRISITPPSAIPTIRSST